MRDAFTRFCEGLRALPESSFQRRLHQPPSSFRRRPESLLHFCILHSGIRAKTFHPPSEGEVPLFCLSKREVPKRKRRLAWRLPGILPGKSVSRGRAFRQDSGNCSCVASTRASMPSPVLTKRSRHPCRLPSGPVVPASPPHRGSDRAAGHRGPHFSEEPEHRRSTARSMITTLNSHISRRRAFHPRSGHPLFGHLLSWSDAPRPH